MRIRQHPLLLPPGGPLIFPDPRAADTEGLVAVGGDLSVERLLLAYEKGIFPWYDTGLPPLWWSPDPRALLDTASLRISRSMRRVLRNGGFRLTLNTAFERVMRSCGLEREGGTWILPEMVDAYTRLHRLGHAHSFEVWYGDELSGGLYGVQRGGLFAAESMFHRRANASKVALIASVISAFRGGIELYDVQFSTPHLASMGAYTLARDGYLRRLARATRVAVELSEVLQGPELASHQAEKRAD